jgi:hypothetical protein
MRCQTAACTGLYSGIRFNINNFTEELTGIRDIRDYNRVLAVKYICRDYPKVKILLNKKGYEALLDTGAELNTIRYATAIQSGLPISSIPPEIAYSTIRTTNGTSKGFKGII